MSQANLDLVQRAYEAFGRGDIPAVLEMFADRVEHFDLVSDGSLKAPWHRPARTRAEVGEYFQAILSALEPLEFRHEHLAAGGEYVYATTEQRYRVRKNGKTLVLRNSVHRFQIRNGRFVGWVGTEDTQSTREALES
jgi:hypothetical protein